MATILYHGEPNGPSLTVLAALAETGVAAELKKIDLAAGARHTGGVPKNVEVDMSIEGEGPVLVVDGEAMADSVFIACYLDDVRTGGAIRPADPYVRWEMMAWCRFVIERIAPAAAFLGTRAHLAGKLAAVSDADFAALTAGIASDDLRERWSAVRAGDFPEARLADSESKIVDGVKRVEAKLGDGRAWLIGDFSIADLETFAWLTGMVDLVPAAFADAPHTRAWMERVAARPSVAQALALGSGDPRQSWAPGPEINRWG